MDGLNRLTGADQTIAVGDCTYRLGPLTLKDYGEIENRILARRPDPIAVAVGHLEGLSEEQQEYLLGRAFDRAVSGRWVRSSEIDEWKQTHEGFCYLFWLMVRKSHPEVTLERAAELIQQLADESQEDLHRRMAEAAGLPEGNRSGQAQPTATVEPPTPPCRGMGGPAS